MAESTVRCSWQSPGQVALVDGMLVFPRGCRMLQGFTASRCTTRRACGFTSGESERLPGRFQRSRTPGGQGERRTTKFRLNKLIVDALTISGRVTVEVATQAEAVASDGTPVALDLNQKVARQRVEHAVEAAERAAGSTLLNK